MFLILCSCFGPRAPVAEIGTSKITEEDVKLRQQVVKVYSSDETRPIGFKQLYEATVKTEILRLWGRTITPEDLVQEAYRIEDETMMPDKLAQIRSLFGDDAEAYRRVFVKPVLVNRLFYYDFFLKSPEVHKESLTKAKSFLSEAIKLKSLKKAASKNNLELKEFYVTNRGLLFNEQEKVLESNKTNNASANPVSSKIKEKLKNSTETIGRKWIDEIVKQLSNGEIFKQVIDDENRWMVIELVKKDKKDLRHLFHGVFFEKVDYEKWFKEQERKLSIKINEKQYESVIN